MDRTLWDRAQDLLDCAVEELDLMAETRPDVVGAPSYRFFTPGGFFVADNCCDCDDDEECGGQLWVRVIRAHPVNPNPTKVLAEVPCPHPIGVRMGLGVIRCAHESDVAHGPPAEELNADSKQMVCDMAALLRALECCDTTSEHDDPPTVVDEWTPIGPAGGCVGAEWQFWWTPRIACPEEEESA